MTKLALLCTKRFQQGHSDWAWGVMPQVESEWPCQKGFLKSETLGMRFSSSPTFIEKHIASFITGIFIFQLSDMFFHGAKFMKSTEVCLAFWYVNSRLCPKKSCRPIQHIVHILRMGVEFIFYMYFQSSLMSTNLRKYKTCITGIRLMFGDLDTRIFRSRFQHRLILTTLSCLKNYSFRLVVEVWVLSLHPSHSFWSSILGNTMRLVQAKTMNKDLSFTCWFWLMEGHIAKSYQNLHSWEE